MSEEKNERFNRPPGRRMLRRTLFLLLFFGVFGFGVVAVRLYQLQIMDHEFYESRAIEQQLRSTTITAHRGTIFDTNGNVLAMSATADTIYISPVEIAIYEEDIDLIAENLSEILGVDYESIVDRANDRSSWYKTIATKVDEETAEQVRAFKNEYDLNGVKIETDTKRYYPNGTLASHVVGFVGAENLGLSGIESFYNESLTGTNGSVVRAKNSAGTDMLFTNFEDYRDAESGNNHVLTIDSGLQYYLEKHLEQAVIDYDIQNGAGGIIMNVNTGEILAMASLGNFDLNNYQAVDDEIMEEILAEPETENRSQMLTDAMQLQWRNKALSDTYEPGSTFKIITLAMALEEGLVSKDDSYYCSGSVSVLGRTTPAKCWKTEGHGAQNLIQSFQHSCNVAFVNIGVEVGAETFYKYAKDFGFFEKTGIDLYGESGSIWWDESIFYSEDNLSQLAAASFGQTFNITPLQLITAASAAVNGGYLYEPFVLKEVWSSEGELIAITEPSQIRQVVSEETSAVVREALEAVVGDKIEGTGKNAYVPGYRIGGKTGTSEKVAQDAAGGDKEYIVSFLGVAPIDDPEIALLILLDTPSTETGIYISGGQMAAPTAGKIFADALPYLGVEPVYTPEEMKELTRTVPVLEGLSVSEAQSALERAGLSNRVVGDGETVTEQMPKAGAMIAPDSAVILYLGETAEDGEAIVPNVSGMSFEDAEIELSKSGFFIRRGTAGSFEGTVSAQSFRAGVLAPKGSVVEVTLTDSSDLGRY